MEQPNWSNIQNNIQNNNISSNNQKEKEQEWFTAAVEGNVETLQRMIQSGFDINLRDDVLYNPETSGSPTALMYACDHGQVEAVKLLLDNGANVTVTDDFRNQAIHYILFGFNDNITRDNQTDTLQRAKKNLTVLLEKGANINAEDVNEITPLELLSRHLYNIYDATVELEAFLLEKGADPRLIFGETIADFLFEYTGAERREIGLYQDYFSNLINHGFDINLRDQQGQTLLILYTQSDDFLIIDFLLDNRADPNIVDNDGKTALDYAVTNNNDEITEILIQNEAQITDLVREGFQNVIYSEVIMELLQPHIQPNRANAN